MQYNAKCPEPLQYNNFWEGLESALRAVCASNGSLAAPPRGNVLVPLERHVAVKRGKRESLPQNNEKFDCC